MLYSRGFRAQLATWVVLLAGVGAGGGGLGCAAEDDSADDDDVAVESEEQAIRNQSIAGRKICVRVKRSTNLYRDPEGGATITSTSKFGDILVTDDASPRYVLVQSKPGRVGSRVWADPDLNGLRADEDIPKLAKRCRISEAAARKAAATVRGNKYTRRAWIDVDDLTGNLRKNLGPSLPNGPAFQSDDRAADGDPKVGRIRTVKEQCLPEGEYRGGNPDDPAGFYTYGTCTDWAVNDRTKQAVCKRRGKEMYVSYGTPEIDGGGLTLGYVGAGTRVHQIATHVHEQKGDHCQTDRPGGGVRCNGDAPPAQRERRIVWSEIWARTPGRTIKGWVPEDCLE